MSDVCLTSRYDNAIDKADISRLTGITLGGWVPGKERSCRKLPKQGALFARKLYSAEQLSLRGNEFSRAEVQLLSTPVVALSRRLNPLRGGSISSKDKVENLYHYGYVLFAVYSL